MYVNIEGYLIFEVNKNVSDKKIKEGIFISNIYWVDDLIKPHYKYFYNSYQLSYDIYLNLQYFIYNRYDSLKSKIYDQNPSEFWKFGENKEPFFVKSFDDWWNNFLIKKHSNENYFLKVPLCTDIFQNSILWNRNDNDTIAYYVFDNQVSGAIINVDVDSQGLNQNLLFDNVKYENSDFIQILIPTSLATKFSETNSSKLVSSGMKIANWKPILK